MTDEGYRGRLAPSPTGLLHLGHARTFWIAAGRARAAGGVLVLRNDDLDAARLREDFVTAMLEDLRWLGIGWQEGPDIGGPFAPYNQSGRMSLYREALERLHEAGLIYPCTRTRKDVIDAIRAPHEPSGSGLAASSPDDEPVYPPSFRPASGTPLPSLWETPVNWRLRVPDGEELAFDDGNLGVQRATVGRSFGDFLVWRKDGLPSYQLSCAVDDATLRITEVVRGADLVKSTFRQILVLRALGWAPPRYFHCPLMTDDKGARLAKRHDALSLRAMREAGKSPAEITGGFMMYDS